MKIRVLTELGGLVHDPELEGRDRLDPTLMRVDWRWLTDSSASEGGGVWVRDGDGGSCSEDPLDPLGIEFGVGGGG